MTLRLRPATMVDADLLLRWANDPAVRAASFNSDLIDADTHRAWLEQRLDGGSGGFYIAENAFGPVGYARVDVAGDTPGRRMGEIAVSVDANWRGVGLGAKIIAAAARRAASEYGLEAVYARLKPGNTASLRAFAAAGFTTERMVWKP